MYPINTIIISLSPIVKKRSWILNQKEFWGSDNRLKSWKSKIPIKVFVSDFLSLKKAETENDAIFYTVLKNYAIPEWKWKAFTFEERIEVTGSLLTDNKQ